MHGRTTTCLYTLSLHDALPISMELLLLNRALPAAEALGWGLVNEVVDDEQLPARALELAEQLARGARSAYGATKRLIARSEEHTSELQSRFDIVCRLLLEKKKQ